ncbi:MAG TPA: hypothetical protein PKD92_00230 [Novosphingobium sp.]|nr:hypothetical protein [Novosphingobium sp.]
MHENTFFGMIKAMAWSGVLLVICLFSTFLMMGFLPPPSPDLPAEAIKQIFVDRKMEIRIATALQTLGFTFYLTWAMSITMMLRPMERGLPVLTWTSIANTGGGYVLFLMMPFTWAALAYRPEILDAWFIQIMNDWTWFVFILSWPPFAVFMMMIGIAILRDHNVPRIMPKWVAYLNFWCAFTISPAILIQFFKTGPFTYAGLIDFWFIFAVFFGWMVVMTLVTVRAADRLKAQAG